MWVRNGGKSQLGHSALLGRGSCHLVILTRLQRWVRDSGRFIHMCRVFVLLQVVLLSLSLSLSLSENSRHEISQDSSMDTSQMSSTMVNFQKQKKMLSFFKAWQ